jgi:glutamate-5-semialdehyde dehydrogenase
MALAHEVELGDALLDRLDLNGDRIDPMAKGLEEVASFPDPLG